MGERYWVHSDPTAPDESPRLDVWPCVGNHGPDVAPEDIPEPEVGLLCYRCFSRLRHNVVQMPALLSWLKVHVAAVSGADMDAPHVSGSHDEPIPLRLDVLDLVGPYAKDPDSIPRELALDQQGDPSIEDTARAWSRLVAGERDVNPPASDVGSMASFLAANLSWIVEQPWVDEFAGEIDDLTRRAAGLAPWQPERRKVKDEACIECGKKTLVTHVAEGVTVCERRMGGCGKRRAVTEYAYKARGREAS